MVKYTVLGSGSKANSYHFEFNDFAFIIDNGFAFKTWKQRVKEAGIDVKKIQFIFITHIISSYSL